MSETLDFAPTSRLGRAHERAERIRAELDAARGEARRVADELRACEEALRAADVATITPAAFAELEARRTLLMGARERVLRTLDQLEAQYAAAHEECARLTQFGFQLLAERKRYMRAGGRYDRGQAERIGATLAELTGAPAEV